MKQIFLILILLSSLFVLGCTQTDEDKIVGNWYSETLTGGKILMNFDKNGTLVYQQTTVPPREYNYFLVNGKLRLQEPGKVIENDYLFLSNNILQFGNQTYSRVIITDEGKILLVE